MAKWWRKGENGVYECFATVDWVIERFNLWIFVFKINTLKSLKYPIDSNLISKPLFGYAKNHIYSKFHNDVKYMIRNEFKGKRVLKKLRPNGAK